MADRFPVGARPTPPPPGEPALLMELADVATRTEIERVLRGFGPGVDRSTARLRAIAAPELDLEVSAHRIALLAWLRAWGCRHLRVADTRRSSTALAAWWRAHRDHMPPPAAALTDLVPGELAAAAAAFGTLAASPAAWRVAERGRVGVTFGETAAAKALSAIRPLAFPPWDAPIRDALGLGASAGSTPAERYAAYLEGVAAVLRRLAVRLRVDVAEVPARLGRPTSSPPRLVDEYLWMRVNR